MGNSCHRPLMHLGITFGAETLSVFELGGQIRRAGSAKRINHHVAWIGMHSNQFLKER